MERHKSRSVATEERSCRGRIADGYRHLCPQCLPLSYWRRTLGNQRDDVQLSGRSAVHGSGRDHQLPTAFSQRRAGELHVKLRVRRAESLPCGGNERMAGNGSGYQLSRSPHEGGSWKCYRGKAASRTKPFYCGDGPHVRMRDGKQGTTHTGRRRAARYKTDHGYLRSGQNRKDRESVETRVDLLGVRSISDKARSPGLGSSTCRPK